MDDLDIQELENIWDLKLGTFQLAHTKASTLVCLVNLAATPVQFGSCIVEPFVEFAVKLLACHRVCDIRNCDCVEDEHLSCT
jgi:hypothetical protein